MNKIQLLFISAVSLFCTIIGIRFLSVYRIRDIAEMEVIVSSAFNSLTSGSAYSFVLIIAIFLTIFGLIFSTIALLNTLSYLQGNFDISEKTALSLVCVFLGINILISLYLLLFLIFLLLIIMFFLYGLYFLITNDSNKGGPIHVRGHFRKGSYVRSHTRKRPQR
ncbi:hypothetical protein P9265_02005 [Schinkia azotoformans]|uniref:hypothetical protein n=1 Tax=Schinkia azotoformans TaxID=1454 RepID=UPI002E20F57B|nr:hypothetical protein [Schinkia azotoformans]